MGYTGAGRENEKGRVESGQMTHRKRDPQPNQESEKNVCGPKYPRPKVLLIDVDSDTEATLRDAGYNICSGSLGLPYRVEKRDGYDPVIINGSLPSAYREQEIVIVELGRADVLPESLGKSISV
jgi:hypothetical protein